MFNIEAPLSKIQSTWADTGPDLAEVRQRCGTQFDKENKLGARKRQESAGSERECKRNGGKASQRALAALDLGDGPSFPDSGGKSRFGRSDTPRTWALKPRSWTIFHSPAFRSDGPGRLLERRCQKFGRKHTTSSKPEPCRQAPDAPQSSSPARRALFATRASIATISQRWIGAASLARRGRARYPLRLPRRPPLPPGRLGRLSPTRALPVRRSLQEVRPRRGISGPLFARGCVAWRARSADAVAKGPAGVLAASLANLQAVSMR